MYKAIVSLLALIIISPSVSAKYITPLNGPGVEITRVFVHDTGAISLYISGTVDNLDNCTSTFRVFIPHDLAGKDEMLTVALTAHTTGKKIGLHGSGCSTTNFWGGTVDVPIINSLWMFQ